MISPAMRSLQTFARPSTEPVRRASSPAAIDSVQLSSQNNKVFEPAAHLDRAAKDYMSLVPTHPTEQDEFLHGATEIQKVVSEVLYGGRWPESGELPELPHPKTPGAPKENGGLTKSEQLVSDDLIQLYRKTVGSASPQQHKRLATAIHLCQSGLQGRVLRRDYPNYWMSNPGSLELDAQREASRWAQIRPPGHP